MPCGAKTEKSFWFDGFGHWYSISDITALGTRHGFRTRFSARYSITIVFTSACPGAVLSEFPLVGCDVTQCASSLFQQPWWLEAVAPNSWDAVVVVENNEIVGRLPFVRKHRLGPRHPDSAAADAVPWAWIRAGTGKTHTQLEREHRILKSLIAALPDHDVCSQSFHYSITNVLPFYWDGFSLSISYTYVIDDLENPDKVWAGFRENIRREIRKAERRVVIRCPEDVETFITLNRMIFGRQAIAPPYSTELIRRVDAACRARGARRIFLAEGADGTPMPLSIWSGTPRVRTT